MQFDWLGISLIFFLIIINAFFAASEIAVISAKRLRIEEQKKEGKKSAAILLKLMENPSLFLATIQVGITLAGFLASATAAVGLSQLFAYYIEKLGIPAAVSQNLGVFSVTLIISYLTLVFGELAPKRLAMQRSEEIALRVARPINFIAKITSPITSFLTFSTNFVVRLLGGKVQKEEKEVSENEIRLYIRENRKLPVEEKQMIEGVFNFGDQVVRQLMIPRTDIVYLNGNNKVYEALEKVCSLSFSTYPVYLNNLDNIIGTINIKDLTCQMLTDKNQLVKNIITKPLFIPETKHNIELLKDFRRKKLTMAIIIDEYGGITGLVTLKDLIDEIIGDTIQEQKLIIKVAQDKWLAKGHTPIQDIILKFNFKEIKLDKDYETIAGFILKQLGHIPKKGERITWEGYQLLVKEVNDQRIIAIEISKDKL